MPRQSELVGGLVVQFLQTEFWPDLIQHAPVQNIEFEERLTPGTDLFHAGLIQRPPGIRKFNPIEIIAERLENTLGIVRHSIAPVYASAEHIENQPLHGIAQ